MILTRYETGIYYVLIQRAATRIVVQYYSATTRFCGALVRKMLSGAPVACTYTGAIKKVSADPNLR